MDGLIGLGLSKFGGPEQSPNLLLAIDATGPQTVCFVFSVIIFKVEGHDLLQEPNGSPALLACKKPLRCC